jgi:hypothetical protein
MKIYGPIAIDLPDFLFGTLNVVTHGHPKTQDEEIRRIIRGLRGLSGVDIRSLPEPPHEGRVWDLNIDLEWKYVHKLLEASRRSEIDISSIIRRIFYALITGKVNFVTPENIGGELRFNKKKKQS